jgi:hypothetical protein
MEHITASKVILASARFLSDEVSAQKYLEALRWKLV